MEYQRGDKHTCSHKRKENQWPPFPAHGEILLYKLACACRGYWYTTCLGKLPWDTWHSRRNALGAKYQPLRAKQPRWCKETKQRCSLLHQDCRKGHKLQLQPKAEPPQLLLFSDAHSSSVESLHSVVRRWWIRLSKELGEIIQQCNIQHYWSQKQFLLASVRLKSIFYPRSFIWYFRWDIL